MITIENTLFVGKVHLHFPALASTNGYALDLISKSNPSEGTLISTYQQEKGRGQANNAWESEAHKNIACSVVLHPHFIPPHQQFYLNQAVALAVFDFVSTYINAGVKLKWSNDIYINDLKVAGILIQNTISAKKITSSVIGIGININQASFPQSLPNPTSFLLQTGQPFELDVLLNMLCQKIEQRYLQLKKGAIEQIQADYMLHLYRYMEEALYQRPDGTVFSGKIIGLEKSGKLLIEHQKGQEAFGMKEIIFVS